MRFGVREICDVVFRAKAAMKVGEKVFYKNEPVLYFDSLKTSSLEGASTTVYATGGRGNARLVAWEGERTVTFTMEDALISKEGLSILTGAGLIAASGARNVIQHVTERTNHVHLDKTEDVINYVEITLAHEPYLGTNRETTGQGDSAVVKADPKDDFIYVMTLDENGDIASEPYIASEAAAEIVGDNAASNNQAVWKVRIYATGADHSDNSSRVNDLTKFSENSAVFVDYYHAHTSNAFEADITPDSFGGNFYVEASTLFRDTNGVDMPAEFVIPNCKVQSNFTFSMAATGDPSTFTFTMDAFPDYTRWNKLKKVYATLQVIETGSSTEEYERLATAHAYGENNAYNTTQKPHIEEYR